MNPQYPYPQPDPYYQHQQQPYYPPPQDHYCQPPPQQPYYPAPQPQVYSQPLKTRSIHGQPTCGFKPATTRCSQPYPNRRLRSSSSSRAVPGAPPPRNSRLSAQAAARARHRPLGDRRVVIQPGASSAARRRPDKRCDNGRREPQVHELPRLLPPQPSSQKVPQAPARLPAALRVVPHRLLHGAGQGRVWRRGRRLRRGCRL